MRVIDADALLEETKKYAYPSDMTTTVAIGIAETWIKNAPTIGGWISVKDRLPEQAGYRCLVSAEYGDGKRTVFTAFTGYGEPGWWTYEAVYMEKVRESDNRVHHNYHITHWMPLPSVEGLDGT